MSVLRGRLLVVATALLTAAGIALAVLWFLTNADVNRQNKRTAASVAALAAGREAVINFNSYNYAKIDQQFALVAGELTGSELTDFNKTRASVKAVFVKQKVVSSARVFDAATESSDRAASTVLVSLAVAFNAGGKSTGQSSLLKVHLIKPKDRWLVDNITPVQ